MTAITQVALCAGHTSLRSSTPCASWRARLVRLLRSLGPYAAIEIFLPGGTLIALLLCLYRRRSISPWLRKNLDGMVNAVPKIFAALSASGRRATDNFGSE